MTPGRTIADAMAAVETSKGPPMRQITDWLKKLGMSEYAKCFSENRIDFSVLQDLTETIARCYLACRTTSAPWLKIRCGDTPG
jgi:SAM domain (Sterile alpha motif)